MKRAKSTATGKIRTTKLATPKFRTEAEEAEWWDTHPREVGDLVRRAEATGAVTHGEAARAVTGAARITTIRLPDATIAKARVLAARKGLRYQTYLKMLIHEGMEREGRAG